MLLRILAIVVVCVLGKQLERVDPRAYNYSAEPEYVSLAITEKLTIPLFGSISSRI
jgi:hypothetical protein